MNCVIQKTDHPKEILKVIEYLEDQVVEAEYLVKYMDNPAVGFLRAMKMVGDAFEDFPAPKITAMVHAALFHIMNKRVMELQKIAEAAEGIDDEEDNADISKEPDGCMVRRVILRKQCVFHDGKPEDCSRCDRAATS